MYLKLKFVKKAQDFNRIISNGKKIGNSSFAFYFQESEELLFGLSVGKKSFPGAVLRNKIKRQLRAMLRENLVNGEIQKNLSIIIIVRKEYLSYNYKDNTKMLLNFLKSQKVIDGKR